MASDAVAPEEIAAGGRAGAAGRLVELASRGGALAEATEVAMAVTELAAGTGAEGAAGAVPTAKGLTGVQSERGAEAAANKVAVVVKDAVEEMAAEGAAAEVEAEAAAAAGAVGESMGKGAVEGDSHGGTWYTHALALKCLCMTCKGETEAKHEVSKASV